jgi:ribosomal protein S12 methylthiotransferase accessory factor
MGITRVGNVTGLDRIGVPVAVAVRPNSRSVSVSQGKGLSLSHAAASALMEAVELFHGEDLGGRTDLASVRKLSAQARVASPASLAGTGRPLPDHVEIPWIEGYDCLSGEPCWVPWEVVHTDYTIGTPHSCEHFLSGTNGLASGNHILEALSSAVCELIERDAVALWSAGSFREQAGCRLDLASVTDADCRAVLDRYEAAGIAPRVWDVTSDIGIAAFVCDIPPGESAFVGLRRFRGAGCHPDRAIALARALTEAAQTRLTYIAGIRDDLPPADYADSARQKLAAALLDAASQAVEPRSYSGVPTFESGDVACDLRRALDRLKWSGFRHAVAVDLTRADFGIPVVRVVIPGLEWDCTHPHYVPGTRARRVGVGAG